MSWVANVGEKKRSQNKILPIAILYIAFTFGSPEDTSVPQPLLGGHNLLFFVSDSRGLLFITAAADSIRQMMSMSGDSGSGGAGTTHADFHRATPTVICLLIHS